MDAKAKLDEELRLRRLDAIERDQVAWKEVLAARDGGSPPEEVSARLGTLLARPSSTPENALRAARFVRAELDAELRDEERHALDDLEARVAALEVGPSRLKVELYNIAQRLGRRSLLEESWFQELFDRSETRAMLDHTEAG